MIGILPRTPQPSMHGPTDDPITEAEWTDIESMLAAERSSPLFYRLYFDGQEHFVDGQYRRAVIDFAVACEVLLKTLVERHTPSDCLPPPRSTCCARQHMCSSIRSCLR
jgi:hypothetical protein